MRNTRKRPLTERFWEKVSKTETCWNWIGSKDRSGYGRIKHQSGDRYPSRASRVSWEMHFGPIPHGMFVLHRCDNPACIRPDHLFLGFDRENHDDMSAKGRRPSGANHASKSGTYIARGSGHANSKLTEDDVRAIRDLAKEGWMQKDIAAKYAVAKSQIWGILAGKTWKHVD